MQRRRSRLARWMINVNVMATQPGPKDAPSHRDPPYRGGGSTGYLRRVGGWNGYRLQCGNVGGGGERGRSASPTPPICRSTIHIPVWRSGGAHGRTQVPARGQSSAPRRCAPLCVRDRAGSQGGSTRGSSAPSGFAVCWGTGPASAEIKPVNNAEICTDGDGMGWGLHATFMCSRVVRW